MSYVIVVLFSLYVLLLNFKLILNMQINNYLYIRILFRDTLKTQNCIYSTADELHNILQIL